MNRIEDSIRASQADNSLRFLVAVGTKTIGRAVARSLKDNGVPYRFYNGDSNEKIRYRDYRNSSI